MRRAPPSLDDPSVGSSSESPTVSGDLLDTDPKPLLDSEELPVGAGVDRYLVVARVAAGGMGVVYLAYDPELDRRVALKVLDRPSSASDRTRALGEAKALARLNHPNVVAVYDVGTLGDRVWVAMEFIEGLTLKQWANARDRSWREVLEVLVAAGDGLCAAHSVDLVHRDVKPDNVMIATAQGGRGIDRVLVTDFGLARSSTDGVRLAGALPMALVHTPVRGTPAYMAPEQHVAGTVDARIDQFGFCVTAWEALYRERPFAAENVGALVLAVTRGEIRSPPADRSAPRWLRRALERGLDPDPAKRWPSMSELVDHLRRGKTRVRRRWIAATSTVVASAVVGTLLVDRARDRLAMQRCAEQGASIAAVWPGDGDATKDRLRDAFAATQIASAPAMFDRTATRLDAWTSAWSERASAECVATVRGRDPALHTAAVACLDGQRQGLAALLETLVEPGTERVRRALPAAAELGRPEVCGDDVDLLRRPMPAPEAAGHVAEIRAELERARSQRLAARYALARMTSDLALVGAEEIGWPPLVAAAMVESGRARDRLGDAVGAEEMLQRAFLIATAGDDPDTAVEAATSLIWVVGIVLARRDDGLLWALQADALLERMGQTESLRAAAVMIARASILRSATNYDAAIAELERGIALRRAILGADHPDVAFATNNLGNLQWERGNVVEAGPLFESALEVLEAALGPDHPDIATIIVNIGNTLLTRRDVDGAERQFLRGLDVLQRALGPEHPEVAQVLLNLGALDLDRGRYGPAIERFTAVVSLLRRAGFGDTRLAVLALGSLGTTHTAIGSFAEADALFDEAVAMSARTAGADHPRHAMMLRNRAASYLERGRVAEATADLEASLAIFERQPDADEQARAATLVLLGVALAKSGQETRAAERCSEASTVYEATTAYVSPGERPDPAMCHATVALARGRFTDAIAQAERWLDLAAAQPPDRSVSMRLVLADALLDTDPARARAEAERALKDALGDRRREPEAWLRAHPR